MAEPGQSERHIDHLAADVRRLDYDRFLPVLLAPPPVRADLVALLAFNLEIAKTREAVSEPMLGQIRLQWWREALEGIYAGTPRQHASTLALADAVSRHDLPREVLERMIDAREFDLTDAPPADLAALDRYVESTSGLLGVLWLRCLGLAGNEAAETAARHVHSAWALVGLMRAVVFHARMQRCYIPDEIVRAVGLDRRLLFDLKGQEPLNAAVKWICSLAAQKLAAARELRAGVPRQAVPALLLARTADLYLRQFERQGFDPLARPVEVGRTRRQLGLLTGKWRNRY